jgi:hypothetical protein
LRAKWRRSYEGQLAYCENVVDEFEGVLRGLERGLGNHSSGTKTSSKGTAKSITWAKVKVLLKEKELTQRLERATSMLDLAVDCYSM